MKLQNKVFLSLLLSFLVISAHAQWARQAKSRAFSRSNGVATDPLGNVYSAGVFVCIMAFDADSLNNNSCGEITPPAPPTPQTDGFLAKHDEDGNLLWVIQFAGSTGNRLSITDVAVDPSGSAYVTGAYTGSIDLITASFNNPDATTEYFIVKVQPDGTPEWAQSNAVDALAETSAQKIAVTSDALYITGLVRGKFQIGPDVDSVGRDASFVASFDLSGAHRWTKRFMEINENGTSRGKALDAIDDRIFVFSSFRDTVNIEGDLVIPPGPNGSINAGVICEYDASGNLLNRIITNTPFIEGIKIHQPDLRLYVTGRAENVTAIGKDTLFDNAGTRAYISSHRLDDPDGDLQWVVPVTATATANLTGVDIDVTASGNIFAGGTFNATTITTPSSSAPGGSGLNGFMIHLNSAGTDQWIQSFGGTGDDAMSALSAREDTRIFAAGYFTQYLRVAGDELYSHAANNGFVARIDICPQLIAEMMTADSTYICKRDAAIFEVTNNAGYSYEWYRDGDPVPSSNSATLEVMLEGSYHAQITSGGCSKRTPMAALFLNPLPDSVVLTNDPLARCEGEAVNLVGPTGTYTFQWFNAGVPTTDLTKDLVVQADGDYSLEITDAIGCAILSDTFEIRFHPYPLSTLNPPAGRYTLCEGNSLLLQADNSQPGMTWQWSRDDIPIAGADDYELEVTTSGIYRAIVRNIIGCATTTEKDTVVVQAAPLIDLNNKSLPGEICDGTVLRLLTRDVPGQTYQWFKDGAFIPGAIANTIDVNLSGAYAVRVNNALCEKLSDIFNLTVNPLPDAIITNGTATSICEGDDFELTAEEAANYRYTWLRNGQPILGEDDPVLSILNTGNYALQITNEFDCRTTSAPATVMVNLKPPASITAQGPLTFCDGGEVRLSANAGTALLYEWMKDGDALNGLSQRTITVSEGGLFQVRVTNSNSCHEVSTPVAVSVVPYPESTISSVPGVTTVCERDSLLLTGTTANANYSYQWLRNAMPIVDETLPTYYAKSAGSYRVVTSQASCRDTSSVLTLQVRPNPLPVVTRNEAFLSIAQFGDIQWFRNDQPVAGSKLQSIRVAEDGIYKVNVVNAEGCSAWSEAIPVCLPIPEIRRADDVLTVSIDAREYRWEYGGIPIAGAIQRQLRAQQSGTYSAVVMSADGCVMETTSVEVCVPYPSINQDELTGVLYAIPNPARSYRWYLDGVAIPNGNTQVHIPDHSGTYTVEITDLEGCVSRSQPLTITPVTGVETDYGDLTFYPNPAHDFLTVDKLREDIIAIAIVDALGRRVIEMNVTDDGYQIDISNLPSGIYTIVTKGKQKEAAFRFMKE